MFTPSVRVTCTTQICGWQLMPQLPCPAWTAIRVESSLMLIKEISVALRKLKAALATVLPLPLVVVFQWKRMMHSDSSTTTLLASTLNRLLHVRLSEES